MVSKHEKSIRKILSILLMVFMLIPTSTYFSYADDTTNTSVDLEWWNFRNSDTNNGITDRPTPSSGKETWQKWAQKYGSGYAAAPTPPIIIDGKLYIGMSNVILELDRETGEELRRSNTMASNVGYAMNPPIYADGKIFIQIGNGMICAIDRETMQIAWTTARIGGQTVSPISYTKIDGKGYLYTGTWSGEKKDGTFFCVSTDDSNVVDGVKDLEWRFVPAGTPDTEAIQNITNSPLKYDSAIQALDETEHPEKHRGFYWSGAYANEKYIAVGSDDGTGEGDYTANAVIYTLNPLTGEIIDRVDQIKGDIRSTIVYNNGALYMNTKGGLLIKVPVDEYGNMEDPITLDLGGMSTASPVVYGNKIYMGVCGTSQFSADSGHNFSVVRDNGSSLERLYKLPIKGYPQAAALVSTARTGDDFDGDGQADGRIYIYFTYNSQPGGIYCVYDQPDWETPADVSIEQGEIFVPAKDKQQYCISTICADREGTLYYKNDSSHLFAVETNLASLLGVEFATDTNDAGEWNAAFDTKIADYSIAVDAESTSASITLNMAEGAIATVAGEAYSGTATVSLPDTTTNIPVVVSKAGKSRTYNLSVRKKGTTANLIYMRSNDSNSAPTATGGTFFAPELNEIDTDYVADWSIKPLASNKSFYNIWLEGEPNTTIKVYAVENVKKNSYVDADGVIKRSSTSGTKGRWATYFDDRSKPVKVRVEVTSETGTTVKNYNLTLDPMVHVASIELDKAKLELNSAESAVLKGTITPSNATDKTVTWSSSNEDVATVDENGKVTAVEAGSATITVTTSDGEKTDSCEVVVPYKVIEGESATVKLGETKEVVLKANGKISDFLKFVFDGKELVKDTDYTLTEGSTVVTLSEEFVKGLKVGTYDYEFHFENGTATGTLTVEEHTHTFDDGTITTMPTFDAEGVKTFNCTFEGCEETKTEAIPKFGFTVKVVGTEIAAENIEVIADGYDASYENWYDDGTGNWVSGGKVESVIPLVKVNLPACNTEKVEITLNNSFAEYQNYIYTKDADASGYTQYVDYSFGDQVDQWNKIATANKGYEIDVPSEDQVIRVQSAYDANYVSHNLYAIAFVHPEHNLNKVNEVAATCEEVGAEEHWKCTVCDKLFSDETGATAIDTPAEIKALGHDWNEPVWTWTGDENSGYTEAKARFTCKREITHESEEAATLTNKKEGSKRVYTATVTKDGKEYTDTKSVELDTTTVNVDFTSQLSGGFLHAPQFGYEVSSDLAEKYGYSDAVEGVSALDVLVAAHEITFDDFADNPTTYLEVSNNNVDKQFGVEPADVGPWDFEASYKGMFMVNRAFPHDGTQTDGQYNGHPVGKHEVKSGDLVEFFFDENAYMANTYNWFTDIDEEYSRTFNVHAGEDLDLIHKGVWVPDPAYRVKDESEMVAFDSALYLDSVQLYTVNLETGALTEIDGAVTEDGDVTLNFDKAGTYTITAYGNDDMSTSIMSLTTVVVEDHELSKTDEVPATCTEAGTEAYWTCSTCNKMFSDEAATAEINKPVEIPATDHEWDAGIMTVAPTFDADGVKKYTCANDSSHTKEEAIPKFEFTVKVDGTEIAAGNIEVIADGYDASYENWYDDGTGNWVSGGKVESIIPLVNVTLPACDTDKVEITLNDSFNEYQNYIYTKDADASGYTQYVDYSFGDQVDQWNKIAAANKAYEIDVPSEDQVIRVQSAYDANYVSHNLYAIGFNKPSHELTKTDKVAPTCTEAGTEAYWTCSVCKKLFSDEAGKNEIEKPVEIAALGHKLTKTAAKKATCTEAGNIEYWTCSNCKKLFKDAKGATEIKKADTVVKATGHKWETPTYTWSKDNSTVTATRICSNDKSHKETETVKTTSKTTEPTTTKEGKTVYTATFKNSAFKTQTKEVAIPKQEPEQIWYRLSGATGLDTMKAIVSEGFTKTGGTVVVATKDGFKDALAASGFAGLYKAPIVLTEGTKLSAQAQQELKRLKPARVFVVGGPVPIKEAVLNSIQKATGVKPVRYYGANSAATSAELANKGKGKWKDNTAIIATNKNFKDALSVAPIAYAKGYPILLADNGTTLTKPVLDALKNIGTKQVIIVGGEAAVTKNVVSQLNKVGIKVKVRLQGANGVKTSAAIANWGLKNGMTANKMGVATSQGYSDALSGAALCGINKSVLVLADDKAMDNASFPKPHKAQIKKGYVFGGEAAVGKKTWNALNASTK